MMELRSGTISLITSIRDLVDTHGGIDGYLFGSAARFATSPLDLDILLVYEPGLLPEAHALAQSLRDLTTYWIVDVIAMSKAEEEDLNFIRGVGARSLSQYPGDGGAGR